jgi:hypothetical protein
LSMSSFFVLNLHLAKIFHHLPFVKSIVATESHLLGWSPYFICVPQGKSFEDQLASHLYFPFGMEIFFFNLV